MIRAAYPFLQAAILLIFPFFLSCAPNPQRDIASIQREFKEKTGLDLVYESMPPTSWKLDYHLEQQADLPKLDEYFHYFEKEFGKYPVDFFAKTGLKTVVFVKDLGIGGQLRTAIPDYYKGILILDFLRGNWSPTYQRHCMHHEYYHMIEFHFHGDAYYKDPDWAALDRSGLRYGQGGSTLQGNSNESLFTHPEEGFVDLYSESALEEDKAEIYASLFISEEASQVRAWSEKDPTLQNKVLYMKKFLEKTDPTMDEAYWTKVEKP